MAISADDHIAIERLMYRYAQCADEKDYAGFSDVFCDDAVFVYAGNEITPLSEIQQLMHNLERYRTTQHRVQNVLYDVEDQRAVGTTYCLASHLLQEGVEVSKIDMAITYRDALRLEDGQWLIARRHFDLLWTQTSRVDATQL